MPTKDAIPSVYDPIEKAEEMVVEALNIGLKLMEGAREHYGDERIIAEICVFAEKYGLLGFMTDLPTTPDFMDRVVWQACDGMGFPFAYGGYPSCDEAYDNG